MRDITGWTQCVDCIYYEDCENKEDRDGCYLGEEDVDMQLEEVE